jgi:tetratricopeptide (TPR) repeat protein
MPGVDSEDNIRSGEAAIKEYEKVLDIEPNNTNSIAGIANIYLNMKKLDEARKWYMRQVQVDPSSAEGYYSVGVIDWMLTYQPRMALKSDHNILPDDPIKDAKLREPLCATNGPIIEDGFKMLNRAMELRPDYIDAMAYVNLMYREKADCEATASARAEDLKSADDLIVKAMELRKKQSVGTTAPAPAQQ